MNRSDVEGVLLIIGAVTALVVSMLACGALLTVAAMVWWNAIMKLAACWKETWWITAYCAWRWRWKGHAHEALERAIRGETKWKEGT